jgi:hypothetical protein
VSPGPPAGEHRAYQCARSALACSGAGNQNRRTEANIQLERALVFYRSVGAIRYVRESEELLAATA